ncbi:hypothetical protein [Candidatus Palauibacter sp.]|uniref:hypothetical protein n=1 Tax=Candidatus Palauibacter sp. TaxID=3101350 RepID=UPI003AF2BEFB
MRTWSHTPFRWLLTDELWEIPRFPELSTNASGDLWRAVDEILREHFPESLHREIREAADIPGDGPAWDAEVPTAEPAVRERESGRPTFYSSLTRRRRRDPLFRRKVLDEYGERCSVCDLDIRLGERLLGVEAAHIQWHSHEGPDEVANGLGSLPSTSQGP